MKYSVQAAITPEAAAKLIITNEIDLSESWSYEQSNAVVNSLLQLEVDDIIHIIDGKEDTFLDTDKIPQFGSIDSIEKVPFVISNTGIRYLSYAQLGYYLKLDVNAKMEANIKFGENHGKGAALIGLAECENSKFSCSSLSIGFCKLDDQNDRRKLIIKLYFRIPIVQMILRHSAKGKYNGYDTMNSFSESTKKRRGQCLRKIFKSFRELNNTELNHRLENVYWEV